MNYEQEQKITPLFSTPLYNDLIDIPGEVYQVCYKSKFLRVDADNGYMSEDKHILDDPRLITFKLAILKKISEYCHEIIGVDNSIKFKITTSWFNKHDPGDEAHSHHHINSLISGVIFLTTPENSGLLRFHNDPFSTRIFPPTVKLQLDPEGARHIINLDQWDIKPGEGKCVIFPSTLSHSVTKNQSSKERYTLAFNVWPVGTLGENEIDNIDLDL